jgi:hypothetical protein
MGRLIFIGLCIFYPKQVAQWFLATLMAGVAAYLTVARPDHIARLGPFELWWIADYILIQLGFALLDRQAKA